VTGFSRPVIGWGVLLLALVGAPELWAQSPRNSPREGNLLHDELVVGPFTVQRWVDPTSPEVSPSGMCECLTLIYQDGRLLISLGVPGEMTARSVTDLSGSDINGDGTPDLIISDWSGGAHCCYRTTVYSIDVELREILSLDLGNCGPGEFEDLDGDGALEFITCDDRWAYAYCTFADSPMPRVVYAFDRSVSRYTPATPRFASLFRDELSTALEEAQSWMHASGGRNTGLDKCRLLRPALGLMYSGRFDDGLVLIRGLYRGDDREQFEKETSERVRQSPHWVAQ